MTDLLIVSYYFPPFGGGAVARVHSFAKYLPEFGVRPTILSVESSYYESRFLDDSLAREYTDDVEIIRTASFEPGGRRVKNMVFGNDRMSLPQRIRLAAMRTLQRHLLIPDRCRPWSGCALRAARRIFAERKPAAVLATTPPATNVGVAWKLATRARVPLIVDYRDLWTTNPFFRPATKLRARIERSLEKKWLAPAAAVLATTDEAAQELRNAYPHLAGRVQCLPNGFDPAKFADGRRIAESGGRVRFAYAGSLTANRSPEHFLRALARVIENTPSLREKIEIRFYGFVAQSHRKKIKECGLEGVAHLHDFVSAEESAQILQEETEVALIFQRSTDGGDTAIPGKLYEYLAAGCTVLAMCDGGPTASLLEQLGVGYTTAYEDVSAIVSAVEEIVQTLDAGSTADRLPAAVLSRYDRRNLTGRLAEIIVQVVQDRTPPP